MAYGHAERNLAAIRQLEAETRELLSGLPQLDLEQLQWLQETAEARLEPSSRLEAGLTLLAGQPALAAPATVRPGGVG
jgi:hypothetical protein